MPKGLPGGMCEGCQEDRDGLWDRQDTSDEGVGQQGGRQSFLVLVLQINDASKYKLICNYLHHQFLFFSADVTKYIL